MVCCSWVTSPPAWRRRSSVAARRAGTATRGPPPGQARATLIAAWPDVPRHATSGCPGVVSVSSTPHRVADAPTDQHLSFTRAKCASQFEWQDARVITVLCCGRNGHHGGPAGCAVRPHERRRGAGDGGPAGARTVFATCASSQRHAVGSEQSFVCQGSSTPVAESYNLPVSTQKGVP